MISGGQIKLMSDLLEGIGEEASEIVSQLTPQELAAFMRAIEQLSDMAASAQTEDQLHALIDGIYQAVRAVPALQWRLPDSADIYRGVARDVALGDPDYRSAKHQIPQLTNTIVIAYHRLQNELQPAPALAEPAEPGKQS